MEISFVKKEKPCWETCCRKQKAVRVSAETVVPDSREDVAQILSVQAAAYLKGKDYTGRAYLIAGCVEAAVYYVAEGEEKISCLNISKEYELEIEAESSADDVKAVVRQWVAHVDARLVNPRKLSLSFEIPVELTCFSLNSVPTEIRPSDQDELVVHYLPVSAPFSYFSGILEKTVTIAEQLPFAGHPDGIAAAELRLMESDVQQIGSRVIVKGKLRAALHSLGKENGAADESVFTLSFSQILDYEGEDISDAIVVFQPTAAYWELQDTAGGDTVLNAEIHAVLQICLLCDGTFQAIADLYSNQAEIEGEKGKYSFHSLSPMQARSLVLDERLEMEKDVSDILLSLCSVSWNGSTPELQLNAVCKTDSGLQPLRRILPIQADALPAQAVAERPEIEDVQIRLEDGQLAVHASLLQKYRIEQNIEMESYLGYRVSEWEDPLDLDAAVTLYRYDGESLWELAKACHSTQEAILKINPELETLRGEMILIPQTE